MNKTTTYLEANEVYSYHAALMYIAFIITPSIFIIFTRYLPIKLGAISNAFLKIVLCAGCSISSFLIIFIHKSRQNANKISTHSIMGYLLFICLIFLIVGYILTNERYRDYRWYSTLNKVLKMFEVVFLFGAFIAMITGVERLARLNGPFQIYAILIGATVAVACMIILYLELQKRKRLNSIDKNKANAKI